MCIRDSITLGCPFAGKMVDGADAALDAAAASEMREHCMHGSLEHAKEALAKRAGADPKATDSPSMRSALHKAAANRDAAVSSPSPYSTKASGFFDTTFFFFSLASAADAPPSTSICANKGAPGVTRAPVCRFEKSALSFDVAMG